MSYKAPPLKPGDRFLKYTELSDRLKADGTPREVKTIRNDAAAGVLDGILEYFAGRPVVRESRYPEYQQKLLSNEAPRRRNARLRAEAAAAELPAA
jgi:hypothetical protein